MRIRTCVLIAILLLACGPSQEEIANGDDPIAALASTVRSSRYGNNYWTEQRDGGTSVWNEATSYCAPAERANHPNCETVRAVAATDSKMVKDPRTQPGFGDF